jgi:hypothetical protein
MAQFYFLSVATLLVGGMLAASGFISRRIPALVGVADMAEHRSVVMTVGILAALVGVVKFFVRAPGDTVRIAGDLLPAVTGIVLGVVLITSLTTRGPVTGADFSQPPKPSLLTYRDPIGLAAIAVGFLHFLFPGAVIL